MMYKLYEYTRFGSYDLIIEGYEDDIEAEVRMIANEFDETMKRINGRFIEFGDWYYEVGQYVYVVVAL